MPRRQYDPSLKVSARQALLIQQANLVIADYQRDGYILTLRQLYYQFVRRNWLKNEQKNYKYLGEAINTGRLAGLIDWNAIEDRTRSLVSWGGINSISKALRVTALGHRNNKWVTQPMRPEIWIEKDALTGVISPVCQRLQVPFFACRGYNSQSEQWRAAQRMIRHIKRGRKPVIFHLGDHDPSGIDMTQDNRGRLNMFVKAETGQSIDFKRIALNMRQIEQINPPPNPVKVTDARFRKYVARYGQHCWELDAIEPRMLARLIERAILSVRDQGLWDAAVKKEEGQRKYLAGIAKAELAKEAAAKAASQQPKE